MLQLRIYVNNKTVYNSIVYIIYTAFDIVTKSKFGNSYTKLSFWIVFLQDQYPYHVYTFWAVFYIFVILRKVLFWDNINYPLINHEFELCV